MDNNTKEIEENRVTQKKSDETKSIPDLLTEDIGGIMTEKGETGSDEYLPGYKVTFISGIFKMHDIKCLYERNSNSARQIPEDNKVQLLKARHNHSLILSHSGI